LCDNYNYI